MLYSSIKGGICLLGDHFSPILLVLAIPYYFWQDPKCILALQVIFVALSAFPLFKIAQMVHENDKKALIFVICFFLYISVRNALRFDFHPEVLVMPCFFWAFYFLKKDKVFWSSAMLAVALLAKENVALVTAMFGLYAIFFMPRKKILGVFWVVFSVFYFFFAIKIAVPFFSKNDYFYLSGNYFAWKELGLQPFMEHIVQKSTLVYLVKIFGPLGFLSFLHFPTFLLTFPSLAQNLLGRNVMLRSVFFQYTALLTPFVFISAVYGLKKLKRFSSAIYLMLFCSVVMSGVSEYYILRNYSSKINSHFSVVKKTMKRIPSNLSVRTHEFLAPHLANRKELHVYENNHPKEGGSARAHSSDIVLLDSMFLGDREDTSYKELLSEGFSLDYEKNGLTVWKNKNGKFDSKKFM